MTRIVPVIAVLCVISGCMSTDPIGYREIDGRMIGASSSYSREDWSAMFVQSWIEQNPARHGSVRVAATGSMLPAVHAGQVLLIERVTMDELRLGDELIRRVDWNEHGFVLHRVVWTDGRRFVTQGDNVDYPDPGYGTARDVLWRVAAKLNTSENGLEVRAGGPGQRSSGDPTVGIEASGR